MLYLKKNYGNKSAREIASYLNRSLSSIYQQAYYVGITNGKRLFRAVRNDEVIAAGTIEEVAKVLGVKEMSVFTYATPSRKKTHPHYYVEEMGFEIKTRRN